MYSQSFPCLSPLLDKAKKFRNWLAIDDDVETMQEQTEEEFTEELVSVILNHDKYVISSDLTTTNLMKKLHQLPRYGGVFIVGT